jgi:DNA mismatch endonuclease (patch repair protein)
MGRTRAGLTPSFVGLQPASAAASRVMRANTRAGGRAERILRTALWRRGHRYRTHVDSLRGHPDIVFRRQRVVVFCDGDFWHGRNWRSLRRELLRRANPDYWVAKIGRNRIRDRLQNRQLAAQGWAVIRVWETDVLADLAAVVHMIELQLGHPDRYI